MGTTHLMILLNELEQDYIHDPVSIYLDSSSAIAIGKSFNDTKHTHHILRRYHYVRAGIGAKQFNLQWINTVNELTDIETK